MCISDWSSDVCSSDLLVAEPAEDDEKGRAQRERDGDQYVRGRAVDLQRLFEEEERIKLPRIPDDRLPRDRSEEHTSELQSLMRISYAVFCLKKKKKEHTQQKNNIQIIAPPHK